MTDRKGYQRSQLLLPLMQTLSKKAGSRPRDIYDTVANVLKLSDETRHRTVSDTKGDSHNLFERDVRWMRQTAVQKGLISNHERGRWSLTQHGHDSLANAQPGLILTVFETPQGHALWSTLDTAIGAIDDHAIDLLFTSPPYPNAAKSYSNGDLDEDGWVSFMMDMISGFQPKMALTGSMMINIAETYAQAAPYKLEHISKLRVRLATETRFRVLDTLYWNNTSRLPSPFSWVAKKRIRLKPSAETILWISEHPEQAKADNRRILTPYRRAPEKSVANITGEVMRPSGHLVSKRGFEKDNGGSIPGNVFNIGATNSSQAFRNYMNACRQEGLPHHPAIMPLALAEKCIGLTTDPGDLVVDPMGGSLTTARAAENLGRRWISNDASLSYIAGSRHRFEDRKENSILLDPFLEHTFAKNGARL